MAVTIDSRKGVDRTESGLSVDSTLSSFMNTSFSRKAWRRAASAWVMLAGLSTSATAAGVVISQIYGGGGNAGALYRQDFVELFNAGSAPVSLKGWSVQYASANGQSWDVVPLGNVTLPPGRYALVQLEAGAKGSQDVPQPEVVGTVGLAGASGKVALVRTTQALSGASPVGQSGVMDFVGYGSASGYKGRGAAASPGNNITALHRREGGCVDTANNQADFELAGPIPRNGRVPAVTCPASGAAASSGGAAGAKALKIAQIQGTGATSPVVGQAVQTQGVVTVLTNTGFFLQDPAGDGDAATSEGLYVALGQAPTVKPGQRVQVEGTVVEHNVGAPSNARSAAQTVTQLTQVSGVSVLGSDRAPVAVPVQLPLAPEAGLERYEGMLVTLAGPLVVTDNHYLARTGQLTLAVGERQFVPTNLHRPGTPQAQALAQQQARSRIVLDDASSVQNPDPTPHLGPERTVRLGDRTASLTGVLDYGLSGAHPNGPSEWRLHPTQAMQWTRPVPRSATPPAVGGSVRVASMNVLNYFTTFADGSSISGSKGQGCRQGASTSVENCRGADSAAEFSRQRTKIIAALRALDADVVGLMEMQNNGTTAITDLVNGLNAVAGAGTYAAVPDPASGAGSDAVKVAMIYKPARLRRVGEALSDVDGIHNRPPLAQMFQTAQGERLMVVVNHFKSKGSCPSTDRARAEGNADAGDGQGCWNGQRVRQAKRLRQWVDGTLVPQTPQVLLLGDFNAHAQEDPIHELTSRGWVDVVGQRDPRAYSYAFEGLTGRLDHALATPALAARVTGAAEWHINADEPPALDYNQEYRQPACARCGPDLYTPSVFRASDHDPVLIGLDWASPPAPARAAR
ncbi:MAG: hypothetical protein RLZZ494_2430 [Pseudomonadota bacterium]